MTILKDKKGFTLAELLVVIAVSSIIFLLIATLAVIINDRVKEQRQQNEIFLQVESCKNIISNFIGLYDNSSYKINEIGENFVKIEDEGSNIYNLSFTDHKFDNKDEILNYIIMIKFEKSEDVLKSEISVNNGENYVFYTILRSLK